MHIYGTLFIFEEFAMVAAHVAYSLKYVAFAATNFLSFSWCKAFLLNKANSQASSAKKKKKRPGALVPVVICGRLERADFTKKRPALLSSSTKANTWPTGLVLCSLQLVVVAQCGHHCHSLLCVRLSQMWPDAKLNRRDGILHYLVRLFSF